MYGNINIKTKHENLQVIATFCKNINQAFGDRLLDIIFFIVYY